MTAEAANLEGFPIHLLTDRDDFAQRKAFLLL